MYKNREWAQVGAGDSENTERQMGRELDLQRVLDTRERIER